MPYLKMWVITFIFLQTQNLITLRKTITNYQPRLSLDEAEDCTLGHEGTTPKHNSAVFILTLLSYFTRLTTLKEIKKKFQKRFPKMKL